VSKKQNDGRHGCTEHFPRFNYECYWCSMLYSQSSAPSPEEAKPEPDFSGMATDEQYHKLCAELNPTPAPTKRDELDYVETLKLAEDWIAKEGWPKVFRIEARDASEQSEYWLHELIADFVTAYRLRRALAQEESQ
jgi:hypothetical protein